MAALREHLRAYLEGWRSDLSPAWSALFDGVEPDLDAIPAALVSDPAFPVIPPRRGSPLPTSPAGGHMFRAFDGLDPGDVSVVLIGQDPYPKIERATGRAFEDGALDGWDGRVAVSLQRLLQSALSLRLGRPDLAATPADWWRLRTMILDGSAPMESPPAWFDRLQGSHGVLFVNAGWTLTRFEPGGGAEQQGHIAMWRPLMTRLLTGLAARADRPLVYLLLGGFAQRLFDASGVEAAARASGRWETGIRAVRHAHPNAQGPSGYLSGANPLARVNEALAATGAPAVAW